MKHSTLTMFRRVMALSLALLLVVGLTGCFGKGDSDPTEPTAAVDPTTAPTDAATEAPTEAATEAPTEPAVKGIMGTVSANNLNVRSNPSIADSTVLSQLPVNLRIEILEQKTEGGTNWYDKGMSWAKANGVSDGSNPGGSITREQLVTMLWRYAGEPKATAKLSAYPDAAKVSDYAADALSWAVETGLIRGLDGNLAPQGTATRAQVATVLMRYWELIR